FPTQVREQKVKKSAVAEGAGAKVKGKKKGMGVGGVKRKHLTLFTRQLSTLQDAGLPLLRSLQILEDQQKPGKRKNVLIDVWEEVQGGASLSDALGQHPPAFQRLYTKTVAASQCGRVLDLILQRLAEFMEKAEKLRRRIKGAMVYPAAVVTVAIGILTFIMWYIIPKFEEIFADFGVQLPALTVWLTNTSRWVAGNQAGQ